MLEAIREFWALAQRNKKIPKLGDQYTRAAVAVEDSVSYSRGDPGTVRRDGVPKKFGVCLAGFGRDGRCKIAH